MTIAQIVISAGAAFAAAWYGVQLKFRQERKGELGRLVAESARVLERADQRRGGAFHSLGLVTDDPQTVQVARSALSAFRSELSDAAQIRGELALYVDSTTPLYTHYSAALERLGDLSVAVGVALWQTPEGRIDGMLRITRMMEAPAFENERQAFAEAVRTRFGR